MVFPLLEKTESCRAKVLQLARWEWLSTTGMCHVSVSENSPKPIIRHIKKKHEAEKHCSVRSVYDSSSSPNPKKASVGRLCTINQKSASSNRCPLRSFFSLWFVRKQKQVSGEQADEASTSLFPCNLCPLATQTYLPASHPAVYLLKHIPGSELPNNEQDV